MGFEISDKAKQINERLEAFMGSIFILEKKIMMSLLAIKKTFGNILIGMRT